MEGQKFFKTKAGGLTLAFLVIMAGFVLVLLGLGADKAPCYAAGFWIMVAAMLYSPVRSYLLDKKKNKRKIGRNLANVVILPWFLRA